MWSLKVKENIDLSAKAMREREHQSARFRSTIADYMNSTFTALLREKGMDGSILFNHEEETLTLHLTRLNSAAVINTTDIKSLSGGERSACVCMLPYFCKGYLTCAYRSAVQLAFLMAVGALSDSPFRVMDEFDVFMDSKNRSQSINRLVEMALRQERGQYLIITPNELGHLTRFDRVCITRLSKKTIV
jgi:hypothetical protein